MSGIPHGLSATQWHGLKNSLPENVEWDAEVRVLDRAHRLVAVLPKTTLEAQVDLDHTSEIDRTMTMTHFDANGMGRALLRGDIALQHYVQVIHITRSAALGEVHVPVFTGIPAQPAEQGDMLSVTASGKESLWLAPSPSYVIKKGTFVVDAIRNGLRDGGEKRRLAIPPSTVLKARVQKDTLCGGADTNRSRWKTWKRLCRAAGYQLYVDGAGWYVVRPLPDAAEVTVEWDERTLLSEPRLGIDYTTLRNRWAGLGAGSLSAVIYAAGAFSPEKLAIGEDAVPWSTSEFAAQDTSLTTRAQLLATGRARLAQLLALTTTVDVNVIPFYALAPLDICRVRTPAKVTTFALRKASIPVIWNGGDAAEMSIGSLKKVTRGRVKRGKAKGYYRPPRKGRRK